MLNAGEDCRVADFEAVEVQDWQNRAVCHRIQEFVRLPGGRQGTRFGFSVTDDAGDNESRVVECGAEGVAQRISEFAALVDGAGRRRSHMARNAARERKLLKQPFHPGFVLADVGIDFAVAALEIGVRDQRRPPVAGTGDVDHVEVMQSDRPVQMDVNEILPRRCSPMPDHQRFDMRQRERLAQQRIRVEVDLTDREVVCGAPVSVELPPFMGVQGPAIPLSMESSGTGMSRGETGTFIVLMPLAGSQFEPPANFAKNDLGKSGIATARHQLGLGSGGPIWSLRNPVGQGLLSAGAQEIQVSPHRKSLTQSCSS